MSSGREAGGEPRPTHVIPAQAALRSQKHIVRAKLRPPPRPLRRRVRARRLRFPARRMTASGEAPQTHVIPASRDSEAKHAGSDSRPLRPLDWRLAGACENGAPAHEIPASADDAGERTPHNARHPGEGGAKRQNTCRATATPVERPAQRTSSRAQAGSQEAKARRPSEPYVRRSLISPTDCLRCRGRRRA